MEEVRPSFRSSVEPYNRRGYFLTDLPFCVGKGESRGRDGSHSGSPRRVHGCEPLIFIVSSLSFTYPDQYPFSSSLFIHSSSIIGIYQLLVYLFHHPSLIHLLSIDCRFIHRPSSIHVPSFIIYYITSFPSSYIILPSAS